MKKSFFINKVVIVTGASMGIGKELAYQLLQLGSKVVLASRNLAKLQNVKEDFKEFSDSILIQIVDVTDHAQNLVLIEETIKKFGRLDILITNAGLSSFGEIEKTRPEVAKQVIDTNIYGSLFPIMAAIPELKKSNGSIMLISSLAGLHGLPGHAPYSLSKMSLLALAQSLRIELRRAGIYVGIAFVGFTENENEKKTLNSVGRLEAIPQRPKKLISTRENTARIILKQLKNQNFANAHFLFGKLTAMISRISPRLLHHILAGNYQSKL
jgi:short-subunit dehydrogenase